MQKTKILILSMAYGLWSMASLAGCAPKPKAKAATTIMVWHWMTDRKDAFAALAKKYQEKTGIKVNFENYAPSDVYTQKVRAAAQGDNLPDLFGVLGEKRDFASYIKAGYIADLTAQMNENNGCWKNSFFAKALEVNIFSEGNSYGVKPGIYGVPIDIMTIQMLYNKKLFKKIGLNPEQPPQTWEEFLSIGKKMKDAGMSGIQGIVSGWAELWMLDCFANNYAFNLMGRDKVLATIKGELPYTDPDWIKVLGLFKQMTEAGIVNKGVLTMVNKIAEQLFANDRAVFAFNGSWCVNVYKSMNPNLEYGAMLPPKISDRYPMAVWGGAGSSFMVNAKSKNKEEAVKFLRWFTDKPQQAYLAEATNNLPANKESLSNISPILADFSKVMDSTTHPSIWGISEFPAVIEAFDRGIQSIILGEKTPEEVVKEVQAIKKRELAKKR